MPSTQASVLIARPVAEAWEYIINAGNLASWEPSVVDAEQVTEGPVTVGTQFRGKSSLLGAKFSWIGEFSVVERNVRTAFKSTANIFAFNNSAMFEEIGEASTRFTYRIEGESGLGGLFGTLTDNAVIKAYGRTLRANLESLSEILSHGF